ncbi:MAG: tRNA epoxyqueuosine(34) reductase QueG [Burkholderiaceae bacterium]|nr:tRNA epoxyqueuosine(34) reductase QueG [Burkholderiaceae bacterium]
MPDGQRFTTRCPRFVRLDHGVGRALDAALHAEGAQQVAHQRGLAGTQIAVQGNEGVADRRAGGQTGGKGGGVGLGRPCRLPAAAGGGGGGFYNGRVTFNSAQIDAPKLLAQVREWAFELGFSQIGVSGVDLTSAEPGLSAWLAQGFHGSMHYMAAHGLRRARPAELVPGTVSVITARMDYLPRKPAADTTSDTTNWPSVELARLSRPQEGVISVYARGRDYHKVLRSRLQALQSRMAAAIGPFGHRVFTDSAPVLEAELAARSGQGWRGKHTLILSREGGSMFFLGEIYVDLALPASEPAPAHCGSCSACIDVCPTGAIVAPYRLDARRCISYLTIEHEGPIPLDLRPLIGNHIYGCDDCQLVCPWNKFAQRSALPDFDERAGLSGQQLVTLADWQEEEFLRLTEGSPIRRIGYERWLRNVAVALGNALRAAVDTDEVAAIRRALGAHLDHASPLVREHAAWGLTQGASLS